MFCFSVTGNFEITVIVGILAILLLLFLTLYIVKCRTIRKLRNDISQKENQIEISQKNIKDRENELQMQREKLENEKSF